MNEKYKYLKQNTIIFAISSFGTKVLSFLLVPLYTTVLSTEEYGTADIISTTATLLMYVLTINISSSVLRFTLDNRKNGQNILSYGFRVLCVGTLFCGMILGVLFFLHITKWPVGYYCIILLYFFTTALYEMMTNYLRAIDKVKSVAVAGIISSFVIIVSNILFLLVFRTGINGYLVSYILGPLIASVFCIFIAKEPLKTYFVVDCSAELKSEMVAYCTPLIFNNLALWINAFLDRYFVTYFCGISANGIYSVSSKIPTILSTCYSVFASAWVLSAIKEFDSEDRDGFFSNTYNTYGALMTMLCSILILFNIPLASLLYSKDFYSAWQYSSILLLSVMFNTFTVFQGSIFSAAKKTKIIARTTIISAVVNTVFNIILIPIMGPLGAALATVSAYFAMWLSRYVSLKKIISMKINLLKDIVIYVLLVFQTVLEHLENHCYIGQVICIALIIYLNRHYIDSIMMVVKRKIGYEKNKKYSK